MISVAASNTPGLPLILDIEPIYASWPGQLAAGRADIHQPCGF